MKAFALQQMTQKRRNASVLASRVAKLGASFGFAHSTDFCMGNENKRAHSGISTRALPGVNGRSYIIIRGNVPQVAGG